MLSVLSSSEILDGMTTSDVMVARSGFTFLSRLNTRSTLRGWGLSRGLKLGVNVSGESYGLQFNVMQVREILLK